MKNSTLTIAFLNSTDLQTKYLILTNIANHYGITTDEAFEEVTDEEAESLMDYITGNTRSAIYVIFKRFLLSYK
jgi:hypothetical protein